MIIELPFQDRWRLLTPLNIRVRRLWGWGYSIQKIVDATEPRFRETSQLLIASDYGGEHRGATHLVYCYLVVRGGARDWPSRPTLTMRPLILVAARFWLATFPET